MNIAVESDGKVLRLTSENVEMRFHAIWLRDSAIDPETRDPDNGHRLITFKDLPENIRIAKAVVQGDDLYCTFSPSKKTVCFPLTWLAAHRYDKTIPCPRLPKGLITWDRSLSPIPEADLSELQADQEALRKWLSQAAHLGFAKIKGLAPVSGALFDVVDLFGYVRETNYGRHFEVRTEISPINLAYTSRDLYPHTDNPYRDPVPTLHILSCIENSAEGGDSAVVDGFAAALRFEQEDPQGFELLSHYKVQFDYTGSPEVHLQSQRPMIELSTNGQLQQIRSNYFCIAPLTDIPFDKMEAYYAAYRRFSEIIEDPSMAVSFKLMPGEAYLVDNTRVLHARKGFSSSGYRWIQGCYADKDGLLSTLAVINSAMNLSDCPA